MSEAQKSSIPNNSYLFNNTHYLQRAPFRLNSTVSSGNLDVVEVHFKTVRQTNTSVDLNNLREYIRDHIRFKLVSALHANSNHFILQIRR